MLKNYIKVAVRNLFKDRAYSFINIGGLAVGLSCTVLILLWVRDELSYDRFHPDAENIYRMNWDFKLENSEGVGPGTPPPLAFALAREVPGVAAATRLRNMPNTVVRFQDKAFSEKGILAADSNMFDLFGFTLLEGNPKTALRAPNSVILTEKSAHRYFGNDPALGKFLTMGERTQDLYGTYQNLFTVTGVVKDPPRNSHIQFEMLTSMSSYPEVAWRDWSWVWMQMATYVRLEPTVSLPVIQSRVRDVVKEHLSASTRGVSYAEIVRNNWRWDFVLQPMTGIYLGSADIGNRLGPTGNRSSVYLFATIAFLILLIACVNFMNLATARSSTRSREVGIRKVLGSTRRGLLTQFLVESLLFSSIAMGLALVFVEAFVEPFDTLTGKTLQFTLLDPPWLIPALALLTVFVALVAGSYPGMYLSSFPPVHAFKRTISRRTRHWSLRNVLVLSQFAIAIGLIASTILIQRQLTFVNSADLGFKKDGIVMISNENNRLGDKVEVLKQRLRSHPQIVDASVSTGVPPYGGFEDSYRAESKGEKAFDLTSFMVDEDFVNTLGIEIVQGHGFTKELSTDAHGVILNEAAVKYLGWDNPLGKTLRYPGGNGTFTVIGVMKDFNFLTLHSPITPFALFHYASGTYRIPASYVIVRINRDDMVSGLKVLESDWKAVAPSVPCDYQFLDRSLESQYEDEHRFGRVFLVFSMLTVMIAFVGLLGLVSYSTEQRTKEIGVRKVLGASVGGVVLLVSKEFVKIVLLANVIAWPAAWYVMNLWLQSFAYHTGMSWWILGASGGAALIVALVAVSSQAIRAAIRKPVEAMRYE